MTSKSKKVLLMRHAKSSWDNPGLRDYDRPLNKRGLRDAPRMGRYLKQLQLIPNQIFSSPAERAKSTILQVIQELDLSVSQITWDENLYFNGAKSYLDLIKTADDSSDLVMTIGHNPMTQDAISALSAHTSTKAIKTATIACFEFPAESWQTIQPGPDALKWIVGPKDLK
ncbi:MAG: histidine phosphatase family protein [Balneolaceae bacterium]|nr:histidine phosphatase family protein [Balneolaceae bacterium]